MQATICRSLPASLCIGASIFLSACGESDSISASFSAHAASTTTAATSGKPDYQAAKYDPIHFKPAIETATDAQCLACHQEVLEPSLRANSPAGVAADQVAAWYQQTSTYSGAQDTFHRRHMTSPLAKELMNMRCITCHQGNDPRDENPGSSSTVQTDLTLRKMVDPEKICLRCHAQMNWQVMGLPDHWSTSKEMFQNNCLLCHSAIRTVRHQVNYLNAEAIEEAAAKPDGGDVCFGCHGGRAWYRIGFPYPRHPWPDMVPGTPEWAKDRMTESEPRFLKDMAAGAKK